MKLEGGGGKEAVVVEEEEKRERKREKETTDRQRERGKKNRFFLNFHFYQNCEFTCSPLQSESKQTNEKKLIQNSFCLYEFEKRNREGKREREMFFSPSRSLSFSFLFIRFFLFQQCFFYIFQKGVLSSSTFFVGGLDGFMEQCS